MKVFCVLLFLLSGYELVAQEQDSLKSYELREIRVFGVNYEIDKSEFPVGRENLSKILTVGGFNIVSKGVFLAQDIYSDGLKRGDYSIVVDGERYHNACPMRMDAPVTRINPIEVETVEIVKSSSNLQSGLGGVISVKRSTPSDKLKYSSNISQITGSKNETDLSFLLESHNNRLTFRFVDGKTYKDGSGNDFVKLYNYKKNYKFKFYESAFTGYSGNLSYTASIMYSKDVVFPYLRMDERKSVIYNSSVKYKDYKLYFNYTDHLMDNGLRQSSMDMETDAQNLTIGFVADFFELFYRNWNADNFLKSKNGKMRIDNHILPDINHYSFNLFKKFNYLGFDISAKAGLSSYIMNDKNRLSFFKDVHKNSDDNLIFPTFGLTVSDKYLLFNKIPVNGMIDISSEAPEAEALYVSVNKLMGKPSWSGNPELKQPLKTSLRIASTLKNINIDLFATYISNYVYPGSKIIDSKKYQTFRNINAMILGFNLDYNYKLFETRLSYNYGENRSENKPLIEILPFQIINKVHIPIYYNTKFYITHTYESNQNRVDEDLKEVKSKAWNRFDLGLSSSINRFLFGIEVENVFNKTYSKHLSYVRDPFSSGMKVNEPGRSFNIYLSYNY